MSDISSTAWFKQTSLETSQWIWGTLSGAFNEKQTIGQIITDAAIGMIPLVGDVTAVRDLLAVSIGLAQDPKKRESTTEWVFLVILLFALIPVIGGIIKGVGRLALKVTTNAAKDTETLKEVVQFLNRIGEGNAPKWLKTLDVQSHQAVLLDKLGVFCNSLITVINKILGSTLGRALPEKWHGQLRSLAEGFTSLRDMGARMIPKALRELDLKLKVIQGMVYKGNILTFATPAGRGGVRRESEAYLIERELREAPKQGTRYPSIHAEEIHEGKLRQKYEKKGYPDLFLGGAKKSPAFGKEPVFTSIASFSSEITAKSSREMARKTIFRAFGNKGDYARESYAAGGFWGYQKTPGSAEEWRELSAVLDEWNANGFLVVLHLPEDFGTRMPGANAWHGKIAEQFGDKRPDQYLKGGGEQVIIELDERFKRMVNNYGNQVKGSGRAMTVDIQGVKAEFYPSEWRDVSGKYGYSKPEEITAPYATTTRLLHDDELRSKATQRSMVNAARVERQTSTETSEQ